MSTRGHVCEDVNYLPEDWKRLAGAREEKIRTLTLEDPEIPSAYSETCECKQSEGIRDRQEVILYHGIK